MRCSTRILKIPRDWGQTMVEKNGPSSCEAGRWFGKVTLGHRKPSYSLHRHFYRENPRYSLSKNLRGWTMILKTDPRSPRLNNGLGKWPSAIVNPRSALYSLASVFLRGSPTDCLTLSIGSNSIHANIFGFKRLWN